MLTAAQIQALLVAMLTGAVGGEVDEGRECIGDVVVLPLAKNPRCNWTVVSIGAPEQLAAIEKAVDLVRGEHPLVQR